MILAQWYNLQYIPHGHEGSLVSGLMDSSTNSWDQKILVDFFIHSDVERILSVPITPSYVDSWYWHGDSRGCYSVKDAYRLIFGDFVIDLGAFNKWLSLWRIKSPINGKFSCGRLSLIFYPLQQTCF